MGTASLCNNPQYDITSRQLRQKRVEVKLVTDWAIGHSWVMTLTSWRAGAQCQALHYVL